MRMEHVFVSSAPMKNVQSSVAHNICRKTKDKYVSDTVKYMIKLVTKNMLRNRTEAIDNIKIAECRHIIHNNKVPLNVINKLKPLAARMAHMLVWELNTIERTTQYNKRHPCIKTKILKEFIQVINPLSEDTYIYNSNWLKAIGYYTHCSHMDLIALKDTRSARRRNHCARRSADFIEKDIILGWSRNFKMSNANRQECEKSSAPPSGGSADIPRSKILRQLSAPELPTDRRRNHTRGLRNSLTVQKRKEQAKDSQSQDRRTARHKYRSGNGEKGLARDLNRSPTTLAKRADEHDARKTHLNTVKTDLTKKARDSKKEERSFNEDKKEPKEQIKADTHIVAATLNLQGAGGTGSASGGKLDEITWMMDKLNIDILALQETKRPLNDTLKRNGYVFIFSSDIVTGNQKSQRDENYQFRANKGVKKKRTPKNAIGGENTQPSNSNPSQSFAGKPDKPAKGSGKGKTKGKGKKHGKGKRRKEEEGTEWHGVGFAYKEKLENSRIAYKQTSSRGMEIEFAAGGGPIKFVNHYAPQSGRPPNERTKFFDQMNKDITEQKGHQKVFYLGDYNAQIHGRREHEEDVLGRFIFGKGINYVEKKRNDREILNRDLLLEVAKGNDLVVLNTWFQKTDEKLITHKRPGVIDDAIINTDKYAAIDHILCMRKHKWMVKNVEANSEYAFPSDHYPVIAKIKIKVLKNKKTEDNRVKFESPTNEEKSKFNEALREKWANVSHFGQGSAILADANNPAISANSVTGEDYIDTNEAVRKMQSYITEARDNTFRKRKKEKEKPWMTDETMELISQRQKARNEFRGKDESELNRTIKKAIQKDKNNFWAKQLEQAEWAEVKNTKKGFVPKHTKIKHKDGTVASSEARPEVLADYFEEVQWGNKKNAEKRESHAKEKFFRNNVLYEKQANITTGEYTLSELRRVLKKAKKGKAPGPDGIPMDVFMFMADDNLMAVLSLINRWKGDRNYPVELTLADIVTIFKKGNVEEPGNYRPIALLQSLYKLHAALLRNRLIEGLDDRLDKAQFGFRARRSTAQPLFVARRLIDIAEASGDSLILVFLDWEKAFDRVDQKEMINAVRRMNVPDEVIKELECMYESIQFRIRDAEGTSTARPQNTGIRQGCPLSPYLFIILMTTMFMDIHNELGNKAWTKAAEELGTTSLLYADDTLLVGSSAKAVNAILATIEKHSDRYGMCLNKKKCEYFGINTKKRTTEVLKFADGKEMDKVQKATYLGGNLQANGSAKNEVECRISKAAVVFNKLKPLWKSRCDNIWKIRVFEAVVASVLYYGLESVVLTKALEGRVDYFQCKCLRNLLKVEAAYYSRVSNKDILDQASMLLHGEPGKMTTFSRNIANRATTLLGHIIRSDEQDLMRKISIDAEFKRVERPKRRVGRPRFFWLATTMERAHKLILKKRGSETRPFDMHERSMRETVAEAAKSRDYPFDKKMKKRRRVKPSKQGYRGRNAKQKKSNKNRNVRNGKERKPKPRSKGYTSHSNSHFGNSYTATSAEDSHFGNHSATSAQNSHFGNQYSATSAQTNNAAAPENRRRWCTAALRRLTRHEKTSKEHFVILECAFTLDIAEIKKTYRKAALKHHPDKPSGDTEKFKKLGQALERITASTKTLLEIHPELYQYEESLRV